MERNAPIGVMDSGIGGLSVVAALMQILPTENIIYFGDTANCPYGNKSNEELLRLSGNMLRFLESRGIKCLALACNTTSALADILRAQFQVPIITVAECAADAIGGMSISDVGLIATVSTARSGIYEKRIHAIAPNTRVYSAGSPNLAALVENHQCSTALLEAEIHSCLDEMVQNGKVRHVILGCTHYPIIRDVFERIYPDVIFLDPAPFQAEAVSAFLSDNSALNHAEERPTLTVYTTGTAAGFKKACTQLGLDKHYAVTVQEI